MMNKKIVLVVLIIIVAMILNEIFTALELVWYIQLVPFTIVILGYIFIEIRSKLKNT